MLRISVLAPMIFGFTIVAVCAEDARRTAPSQLTCDGSMNKSARKGPGCSGDQGLPRSAPEDQHADHQEKALGR